ncbi:nucleoporin p58/p45-like isoform X2 [Penaeus japonicus]|uniref:nucleoporin p58/p45-like isoform X2 n=1 Tax=Penaeus japonicus TaxID=27405 RepID=UPI001C70FFFC|nr:nucleoporin p58/p45-like isoform X2 [Penaeus japonicus]
MATFGIKSGGTAAGGAATGGGFSFGNQNPATGGGFSFGQPQQQQATPAAAATAAAPQANKSLFGTPPAGTQRLGFNFSTLGGAPNTSTATSSSGFLGGATQTQTAGTTGFSLGGSNLAPTATSSAAGSSSGFSFTGLGGATVTSAAPATDFSAGLGGAQALQTSQAPKLGGGFGFTSLQTTTTTTSSTGLGGISIGLGGAQPPSANAGNNNVGAKTDGKSAKEQLVSNDLFSTISVFESRRDAENSASEENIRQTAAPFHKVAKKAEEIQQLLAELASEYQQLHASAVNLKAEVMKEAEHVEMARRTKETPMALQGENKAPEMYFINLVRYFESEMMYCRTKIEEVSLCMQAASNPCETPDDISEVLQHEHDTLKELASKVYTKHSQLVELGHRLNTSAMPHEQGFFRPQSKEDTKTPASAVVRPVLGGSSGLQAFQEQQERAKAVTLGAAPPTMPLAQTTTPSMFGSNPNASSIFPTGSGYFGTGSFNLGSQTANTSFGGSKTFGTNTSTFGAFGSNTSGVQQSSPFAISSPFNTKPFGDDDGDSRRKRRL